MILTMPSSPGIRVSEFGLISNTQVFRSPTTGSIQTRELPGARWFGAYSLPPMDRSAAAAWRSFLAQMRGQAGRAYGFDPDHKTPIGSAGGAPFVLGAGQVGTSLQTSGWPVSVQGVLLPGDYMQVGTQLLMVTESVDSDASGQALVRFEPPIRVSPAEDQIVVVNKASCVMALDDATVVWSGDSNSLISLSFSMTEVFS